MAALIWRQKDAEQFTRDVASHTLPNGMPLIGGGAPTIEELEARQTEITFRVAEIDQEFSGVRMADEAKQEWNTLNEEHEANIGLIAELRSRQERVRELKDEGSTEEGTTFSVARSARSRPGGENLYDVASVRRQSAGPEDEVRALRDNVMRAIEKERFPNPNVDNDAARAQVERLMEQFADSRDGEDLYRFTRHILQTGSPQYRSAFGKLLKGVHLNPEESRAMSLTGSAGGYAIPYTLDPTVIYTGTGSVNPYRQPGMARQIQIIGNEWRGVSSDGIVASYGDELTETTDNSPTLAQPTANVEKAQAWIPFSIEVGEDWGSLQGELAKLLQKGKDKLEATKFTSGAGHGSHEPEGILTGATGTVAGGSATYAVANLYALEQALDPEFQPNASWLANRAHYNRIRQLDDYGGADLWMQLPQGLQHGGNIQKGLLGYQSFESSAMSTSAANGQTVMVFGDFDYFAVVDRIGMSLELIPHVMGASGRPIGQRGVYAHWRNTSKVLTPNAFKKQVQTA